jgi:hypothetical protein
VWNFAGQATSATSAPSVEGRKNRKDRSINPSDHFEPQTSVQLLRENLNPTQSKLALHSYRNCANLVAMVASLFCSTRPHCNIHGNGCWILFGSIPHSTLYPEHWVVAQYKFHAALWHVCDISLHIWNLKPAVSSLHWITVKVWMVLFFLLVISRGAKKQNKCKRSLTHQV